MKTKIVYEQDHINKDKIYEKIAYNNEYTYTTKTLPKEEYLELLFKSISEDF